MGGSAPSPTSLDAIHTPSQQACAAHAPAADPTAHRVRTPGGGRKRRKQNTRTDRAGPRRSPKIGLQATPCSRRAVDRGDPQEISDVCTPRCLCWPPHRTTHAREAWLWPAADCQGVARRRLPQWPRAVSPLAALITRCSGGQPVLRIVQEQGRRGNALIAMGRSPVERRSSFAHDVPARPRVLIPMVSLTSPAIRAGCIWDSAATRRHRL